MVTASGLAIAIFRSRSIKTPSSKGVTSVPSVAIRPGASTVNSRGAKGSGFFHVIQLASPKARRIRAIECCHRRHLVEDEEINSSPTAGNLRTSRLQDIFEPLSHHQNHPSSLLLQNCVRGNRRPMIDDIRPDFRPPRNLGKDFIDALLDRD